jgi:hypothetical protein
MSGRKFPNWNPSTASTLSVAYNEALKRARDLGIENGKDGVPLSDALADYIVEGETGDIRSEGSRGRRPPIFAARVANRSVPKIDRCRPTGPLRTICIVRSNMAHRAQKARGVGAR